MTCPPHLFRLEARKRDIPAEVVSASLTNATAVRGVLGLPPVLTLMHLSELSCVDYRTLRKIVARKYRKPYHFFRMRKRLGGYRLICVPTPALLRVQRWIARHILRRVSAHPASMAYEKGQSALNCAKMHCGCRWLIKMDIRQFFESITEKQVYNVFRSLGYRELISFEFARICTRIGRADHKKYTLQRWKNDKAESYSIHKYRNIVLGNLPQGAATSPGLSNLVAADLDTKIAELASKWNLVYTRYADDIIFSSDEVEFNRTEAMSVIEHVERLISSEGFRPHTMKTSVSSPGARKVVLGLLVDGLQPKLTRQYKSRIEQHIYYLDKYGPAEHAERRGFKSLFSLRAHIDGLLSYAAFVDPSFTEPLNEKYQNVDWPFNT